MARRTKEDAEATRQAILEAAVRVFAQRGVSRASLEDIAREAGVTRGAIYWHFTNKIDLLNALWDQVQLQFDPITQASENPDEPDPLGRIRSVLLDIFVGLAKDPQRRMLFRIMLDKCEAVAETGVAIHLRRINCQLDGAQRVETLLRRAAERGQIPADSNFRLAAAAMIAYIDGLLSNCLLLPEMLDLQTDIPLMLDGLFRLLQVGFSPSAAPLISPN